MSRHEETIEILKINISEVGIADPAMKHSRAESERIKTVGSKQIARQTLMPQDSSI